MFYTSTLERTSEKVFWEEFTYQVIVNNELNIRNPFISFFVLQFVNFWFILICIRIHLHLQTTCAYKSCDAAAAHGQ